MAKPRVFVSSTYYDLKHIRRSVEQFIESIGYEATVYESGDVPFSHDAPLDESCYREIGLCHMLVLIIGGRYGSSSSDGHKPKATDDLDKQYEHYNSITKREYEMAREQDLPIYIFVEKGVLAEFETYKRNRTEKIRYAHVDSVNIFKLLEEIFGQSRNNLVREFANADDITSWLRDQWAGLLAHFISQRRDEASVGQIKAQIESLSSVVSALKTYSEQVLRSVSKKDSESLITQVDKELESKQHELSLRRVRIFDHLLEAHGASAEALFAAVRSATSMTDLMKRVREAIKPLGCGVAEEDDAFLMESRAINVLRRKLGQKPFDHENKDRVPD